MARNGSGTMVRDNSVHTGNTVWQADRDASANILAERHDEHDQDIANEITNSIAIDGQSSPTANLPMAGFKHTNTGAATARTDYAQLAQVQDGTAQWAGESLGSSNAYQITLSPAVTVYVGGLRVSFVANHSNTGAATLSVNGSTAVAIEKTNGVALAANDIRDGHIVEVIYDDIGDTFRLLGPIPDIVGTTYQVTVTKGTTGTVLSLPQNVHTNAHPTFASLTLNGNLSCSDIAASDITCATLDASGNAECKDLTAEDISCVSVVASGDVSCEEVSCDGISSPIFNDFFTFSGNVEPDYTLWLVPGEEYVTLRTVSPTAATAEDCANVINTIIADLQAMGMFR